MSPTRSHIHSSCTLAPAFDDVLRARKTKVEENARRRSKTIEDVEARLERAVQLGLIDKTASFELNQEISKIVHMKIGNETKKRLSTSYSKSTPSTLDSLP